MKQIELKTMLLLFTLTYLSFYSYASDIKQDNPLDLGEESIKARFNGLKAKGAQISYEQLTHPNPGCPENSICDINMAGLNKQFETLINKLKSTGTTQKQQNTALENFRKKYGLPTYFLAKKKVYADYGPTLFNSPCEKHNPKEDTENTIYKAMAYIGSVKNNQIQLSRGKKQLNLPMDENVTLAPIDIYRNNKWRRFYIPLNEKPLYLTNETITFSSEFDGIYWRTTSNFKGEWHIDTTKNLDQRIHLAFDRVDCPNQENLISDQFFDRHYCVKVFNTDIKKEEIVRLNLACN